MRNRKSFHRIVKSVELQLYTNILVSHHVMRVRFSSNEMLRKAWCVQSNQEKIFSLNFFSLQDSIQCDLNGHCQITIDNRHICTFCRLKKCFDCGMQIELIRCSRQGNNRKSSEKKALTTNSVRTNISFVIDLFCFSFKSAISSIDILNYLMINMIFWRN